MGEPPGEPPEGAEQPPAEDHVFRFPLDASQPEPQGYEDPLLELVRGQLADLLEAVILTSQGRRVAVDGFRLLQEPETQYEIWPEGNGTNDSEQDEAG